MPERQLRMTYDPEADAAFIYVTDPIQPGSVASGSTLDRDLHDSAVNAVFDAAGHLLGIEMLGASRLLRRDAVPNGS
jgi:uncharacterized protein YuzE